MFLTGKGEQVFGQKPVPSSPVRDRTFLVSDTFPESLRQGEPFLFRGSSLITESKQLLCASARVSQTP